MIKKLVFEKHETIVAQAHSLPSQREKGVAVIQVTRAACRLTLPTVTMEPGGNDLRSGKQGEQAGMEGAWLGEALAGGTGIGGGRGGGC